MRHLIWNVFAGQTSSYLLTAIIEAKRNLCSGRIIEKGKRERDTHTQRERERERKRQTSRQTERTTDR